ncbi:hypothetical protein CRG98_042942 [Punica granatum]|uniref:Uncharacterized protein n=1 Tax=Punica granatum TaxID=22663 RepID=A0A2I0HY93_PUNGR|nr:hypothetical protein CRG98_042942 [Punica granatum]
MTRPGHPQQTGSLPNSGISLRQINAFTVAYLMPLSNKFLIVRKMAIGANHRVPTAHQRYLLLSGFRVQYFESIFAAFRTPRPHLLLSGLRVRFTAFRTSRPRNSRPVYCFLDFASTYFASDLLLSGLRVHGLRVRFTAFQTSRPVYCFPDFASGLLLSGLHVHFTAFRTSRPHLLLFGLRVHFTCFPRALAHHLPLHILQIPIMLLSYDRRGEPPRRTTTEAVAGTKKDAFPARLPRRPIYERTNGTWKQTYTHPRTTRTMKQDSDCISGFILVSRVDFDPGKRGPFSTK